MTAGQAADVSLPAGLTFADTPSRFVAFWLDGFILSAISAVPLGLLGFYDTSGRQLPGREQFLLALFLNLAISAVYYIWFWSGGRRATPGQRVFEIQVGNAFDGRSLTLSQAFARFMGLGYWLTLFALLPFLAFALASATVSILWEIALLASVALSPTKQGLHDRFANSAVVRPAGKGNGLAVGCVWLFVGLMILSGIGLAASLALLSSTPFPTSPEVGDPLDSLLDYYRTIWPE